jgi:hypothetical protein
MQQTTTNPRPTVAIPPRFKLFIVETTGIAMILLGIAVTVVVLLRALLLGHLLVLPLGLPGVSLVFIGLSAMKRGAVAVIADQ